MAIEFVRLAYKAIPFEVCPKCGDQPFKPMMRGLVHSWWRILLLRPYCAVICSHCKAVVGYEKP